MSFVLRVDPKKRAAGRFIGRVRDELVKAYAEMHRAERLTQRKLALALDVDRARVSRALKGGENLTLRSVAELAWAMKRRIVFYLEKVEDGAGSNNEVLVQPKRSVTPVNAEQLWSAMPQGSLQQVRQATLENV